MIDQKLGRDNISSAQEDDLDILSPKNWEGARDALSPDSKRKLEEKEDKIFDELKSLKEEIFRKGNYDPVYEDAYTEQVAEFSQEYRKKGYNWSRYRLHHLLAGSTPSKDEHFTYFDFPGEYSVENFLKQWKMEK